MIAICSVFVDVQRSKKEAFWWVDLVILAGILNTSQEYLEKKRLYGWLEVSHLLPRKEVMLPGVNANTTTSMARVFLTSKLVFNWSSSPYGDLQTCVSEDKLVHIKRDAKPKDTNTDCRTYACDMPDGKIVKVVEKD